MTPWQCRNLSYVSPRSRWLCKKSRILRISEIVATIQIYSTAGSSFHLHLWMSKKIVEKFTTEVRRTQIEWKRQLTIHWNQPTKNHEFLKIWKNVGKCQSNKSSNVSASNMIKLHTEVKQLWRIFWMDNFVNKATDFGSWRAFSPWVPWLMRKNLDRDRIWLRPSYWDSYASLCMQYERQNKLKKDS